MDGYQATEHEMELEAASGMKTVAHLDFIPGALKHCLVLRRGAHEPEPSVLASYPRSWLSFARRNPCRNVIVFERELQHRVQRDIGYWARGFGTILSGVPRARPLDGELASRNRLQTAELPTSF